MTRTLRTEQQAKRAAEAEQRAASQHFGTVGKREVFALTCLKSIGYTSAYGDGIMYLLSDENGNIAKWATSAGNMTVGKTYSVKATVKKHDDYQGTAQTVLTRCAVLGEIARAA